MQDQTNTWVMRASLTTVAGVPQTAIQYQASTTNAAEILFIGISQSGATTSAMDQVQLLRKTGGATVTIGAVGTNIFDATANGTASGLAFRGTLSTSATGVVGTAEGTDGNIFHMFDFNNLAGYQKDFQPAARLWVPASGIVAVKIKAVVALTYNVEMVIKEMK